MRVFSLKQGDIVELDPLILFLSSINFTIAKAVKDLLIEPIANGVLLVTFFSDSPVTPSFCEEYFYYVQLQQQLLEYSVPFINFSIYLSNVTLTFC